MTLATTTLPMKRKAVIRFLFNPVRNCRWLKKWEKKITLNEHQLCYSHFAQNYTHSWITKSSFDFKDVAENWGPKRKRQRRTPLKSDSDDATEMEVASSNKKGRMLKPLLNVDGASDSDLSKYLTWYFKEAYSATWNYLIFRKVKPKVNQGLLRPKVEPIRIISPALNKTGIFTFLF